jgi:hypothetical protein
MEAQATTKGAQALLNAIENVNKLRTKHRATGAADSEGRHCMYYYIEAWVKGEDPKLPTSRKGWQLYTPEPGEGPAFRLAVKELNEGMRKLKKVLDRTSYADTTYVIEDYYGWWF